MIFKWKNALSLTVAFGLVGCGSKGFSPTSALNCESCFDSSGAHDKSDKAPISFSELDLQGAAVGGLNDKALLITFNKTTKMFQIKIPVAGLNLSLDQTLPQVPGSRVRVVMDDLAGNGVLVPTVFVEIPGVYVLGKLGFDPGQYGLDPKLLPSGDDLPPTPGGEAPQISFLVPNINHVIRLYLGLNVVAVFVEAGFIPVLPVPRVTYPIKNKSKSEVIGYTSLISKKPAYLGGFFVSLVMPRPIAGALDDFLSKFIVNESDD
jgi:hypothetical protein